MVKFYYKLVLGLILLLGMVSLVGATTLYPYVEWIDYPVDQGVSLFILPDGSGPAFTEAQVFDGGVVDATISLKLAFSGFPAEDVWLEDESGQMFSCVLGFSADSDSDAYGEMTFSSSLFGGGHCEGPIYIYVVGSPALPPDYMPVPYPPLDLRFNSADINADGMVNLTDVGLFSNDFYGEYNYRSDFLWDGYLNLSDVGKLAMGLGSQCP